MINKLGIFLTVSLLVFSRRYRLGGLLYIQIWELSLILCLLFWLYHIAITKRINIELDALNLAIIVFLFVNIFSSIRMPDHAGAFMQGGMWYNLRTFEPVLLYLIVSDFLTEERNIKSLILCMLTVLCFESVLGILQSLAHIEWPRTVGSWTSGGEESYLYENPRGYIYYLTGLGNPLVTNAIGTFGHFNAFGPYLMLFVPLLVSFVISGELISRKVAISLAGLTISALIMTYSRSILLGTALGLMIMLLVEYRFKPVFLLICISAVSCLAVFTTISFMSRGYEESLSFFFRLDIWQRTLDVILRDPINFFIGTGSGTNLYWTQYEAQGHYYSPHNAYLMIWLETGVFGFLSFVAIFFILFVRSLKTYLHGGGGGSKSIVFAILGIIPGLLVMFCFDSSFADHSSKALILVFVALGANANRLCSRQ